MDPKSFAGIIPATVLPFDDNYEISEQELRRVIRFLKEVPGITGLACNGRAGDIWALSREEARRVIEIHVEETQGDMPIIAGIKANTTAETIELMQDAKAAGAGAVLILPPEVFRGITQFGPEIPVQFFTDVARAVDIPIVVFQNREARGYAYTPETLARLVEIENVVAVKNAIWEIKRYEQDLWALRRAKRKVPVLTACDTLLFASFLHGADGALIGLASLVPHWSVELFQAVQRRDIDRAREINDYLFPLVEALYQTPGRDPHGAIKEVLFVLGVLRKRSFTRRPHPEIGERDQQALRKALEESGLRRFYKEVGIGKL